MDDARDKILHLAVAVEDTRRDLAHALYCLAAEIEPDGSPTDPRLLSPMLQAITPGGLGAGVGLSLRLPAPAALEDID